MSHAHVFAYGSNLYPERMVGRVPSAEVVGRASLARHDLVFHMRSTDGSGKADAWFTGDRSHRVEGVVYRVDPRDLPRLDRAEGGYSRRLRPFRIGKHAGVVQAWTYHACPERVQPGVPPFDWYHELVVEGARRHGIDSTYIQRLTGTRVVSTGHSLIVPPGSPGVGPSGAPAGGPS